MPTVALGTALSEVRQLALVRAGLTEEDVASRLQARAEARAAKDFARGDEIRLELAAKGVMVMDTAEGSTWRPGLPPSEVPAAAAT
jgi:cysteinyl-tRNA synthetase